MAGTPEMGDSVEEVILADRKITIEDNSEQQGIFEGKILCLTTFSFLRSFVIGFPPDNAKLLTAPITVETISQSGWRPPPHPPYSLDLAPSDFYFDPLKVFSGGTKFLSDNEAQVALSKIG